ncbi:glycogen-binding domain-containing protein [Poriferisphaera sp. WC338]|uniref:glycogen-binding domain-containing protein n=1 Tax=Poriferisphaera sp. WC338 TaxID=3425129 RepID=UPI003D815C65
MSPIFVINDVLEAEIDDQRQPAVMKRFERFKKMVSRQIGETYNDQYRKRGSDCQEIMGEADSQSMGHRMVLQRLLEAQHGRLHALFGVSVVDEEVVFVQPFGHETHVSVVGGFNDWDVNGKRFDECDIEGIKLWCCVIALKTGYYEYRLKRNGKWSKDFFNPHVCTNSFGSENHIVVV